MMDLSFILFWALAMLTVGSAIGVVITQDIVRAAAWLLFTLVGTAALFFLLGADFVGATQLIVYVGGTLVLVVFGVMLTAQGPFVRLKAGAADWAIALTVGLALLSLLLAAIAGRTDRDAPIAGPPPGADTSMNGMVLGEALLGIREAAPVVPGRERVAYLLPFEIVSVHLLVVLVGAAYLARAKRRRRAEA